MVLDVAHLAVTRAVNGPGRRFTVWVQGCPRACPGCFNPDLQPSAGGRRTTAAALAREAVAAAPWDGITLSGGEPFDQASGLGSFLDRVRAVVPETTAIAFTGYGFEELRAGRGAWRELLARLDLLVDGPYRAEEASTALPLRGSANQRLVALTPAGERLWDAIEAAAPPRFEVLIREDGGVVFTGFPPRALVEATRTRLGAPRGSSERVDR